MKSAEEFANSAVILRINDKGYPDLDEPALVNFIRAIQSDALKAAASEALLHYHNPVTDDAAQEAWSIMEAIENLLSLIQD